MREEFYVETQDSAMMVSAEVVNGISQYIIAQVSTEEELNDLVIAKFNEQEARKEALKLAYREFPIVSGYVPIEVRREMQEKRNALVEKIYAEIMSKYVA